jgi:hypothetical protein
MIPQDLILEIEATFIDVPRGSIGLREAAASDDRAPASVLLRARSEDTEETWRDISDEILKKHQYVLAAVDDQGFKFLIPAIMRWSLKDRNFKEWLSESLFYNLLSGSRDPKRRPMKLIEKYKLTQPEIRTVVLWLDQYIALTGRHPAALEVKGLEEWASFIL